MNQTLPDIIKEFVGNSKNFKISKEIVKDKSYEGLNNLKNLVNQVFEI